MLHAALAAFAITALLALPVIRLLARLKKRQNILHYVDNHTAKQGTPSMGGVLFIVAAVAAALCFMTGARDFALAALGVMTAYGIVGFLDDFIKVRYKRNLGLHAAQKILAQLAVAVAVAVFVYRTEDIGTQILLPFVGKTVELGWGIIPFVIFIFLAATNSVNLTDGLDGLAGGVTAVFLVFFCVLVTFLAGAYARAGEGAPLLSQYANLGVCAAALAGGVGGFLLFNAHPARVFMGDTGSLALGGMVASLLIFTRTELLLPVVGCMYAASALSVVIQVLHFKRTRRRVFLMAPLHHHFERKGCHEAKIAAAYALITAGLSAATLAGYFIFFKG
jgi:phospho-N-acetylmuramoyl-pentapeptide-transferase